MKGEAHASGAAGPLFEASGCAVAVDGATLLADVAFMLAPGGCIVLAGPSGCGKTTFLRALAGLDDFDAGDVRFHGAPRDHHGWPEYRRRAVYAQQKPVMLDATVEANLRLPFSFRRVHGAYDPDRAFALLDRLGLNGDCMTQNAQSLSIGQQQRVGVARALLVEPDVLLLDEPSSALDAAARDRLIDTLTREHLDRGGGIIVCAHDREFIDALDAGVIDLHAHMAGGAEGGTHAA
jgi:putative ABC transport system ATP-binding protein